MKKTDKKEKNHARRKAFRADGFTFIEILVVLIILALIAGVVGTNLLGEAESAKADSSRIQIRSLEAAFNLYRLHNGRYPSTDQGLEALISVPEVGRIPKNWQGPYINSAKVPLDGWQNPFKYESDGRSITITSLGADGAEGGSDLDADISNRE